LTSIQLPLYEIGRTAVNTLINHIENPELPDEEIILPTSLALRASTGMAPAG
jgi:DNA-binding LacI/PurR family transcriptional regulator